MVEAKLLPIMGRDGEVINSVYATARFAALPRKGEIVFMGHLQIKEIVDKMRELPEEVFVPEVFYKGEPNGIEEYQHVHQIIYNEYNGTILIFLSKEQSK